MKRLFDIARLLFCFLMITGCDPVINMMAFHPDTRDGIATDNLPTAVQERFITTRDRIQLQAYFLPEPKSNRLLIYFHGNAGNLSHRLPDLLQIRNMGINTLAVSYRGYGKSQGTPSEEGIYADGEAALEYAVRQLGFPLERIILLGRSIGTTVATHIAQQRKINGLILVTPLTSGKDQATASGLGLISFLAGNAFDNRMKIRQVSCPVLIIHGTSDQVIPYSMGKQLYETANDPKRFVTIPGAGHNNLSTEYSNQYWPTIFQFIAPKNSMIYPVATESVR